MKETKASGKSPALDLLPPVFVLGVSLFGLYFLWKSGFRALSDDDYSRVVIAQNFAESPALDPSKTSWLPFPFWVNGLSMLVFGASLETARGVSVALSLASAGLLLRAATNFGLRPLSSALAVSSLVLLPTLRPFALATVPEYFCHTSLAFALVALATRRDLILGGALLFFATLSRYETWPAALVAGAFALLSAVRTPTAERTNSFVFAGFSLLGPLSWSAHGLVNHGSATFYVKRVVAYKAALGTDARSAFELFTSVPRSLAMAEPGVFAVGVVAIIALLTTKRKTRLDRDRLAPLLLPLVALVIGLVLGDYRGGAPTHHPERTLLATWLVLGLAIGVAAETAGLSSFLFSFPLLGLGVRAALVPLSREGTREAEEAAGNLVFSALGENERVVVSTTDYGYFAILASAGHPSRFTVLDTHDPRERGKPLPIPPRILSEAERTKSCYAIVPLCVEMPRSVPLRETSEFTLARLERPGCEAKE